MQDLRHDRACVERTIRCFVDVTVAASNVAWGKRCRHAVVQEDIAGRRPVPHLEDFTLVKYPPLQGPSLAVDLHDQGSRARLR